MKAFTVIVFFLFNGTYTIAQSTADFLKLVLSNTIIDKKHLEEYLKQIQKLPPDQIENGTIIRNWIITNAANDSLTKLKANTYLALGKAYTIIANYERGAFYLTSAQSIAEKNKFYITEAEALNALGSIYRGNEQHTEAADYFKKSLAISRQHNFQHGIARALFNIGSVKIFVSAHDPAKLKYATDLMVQNLAIVKQLKDTTSIINQSPGIVSVYITQKNYEAALKIPNSVEILIKAKR